MEALKAKFMGTSLDANGATDSDVDSEILHHEYPTIPALFSNFPPIRDTLVTESSEVQDATVDECLPYLTNPEMELNSCGIPKLRRQQHIKFLTRSLTARYPAGFTAADASRPWFPYWSFTGLYALGVDVQKYNERAVATFQACQNPTGGFGGGHGQFSHIAATYAAVLSLVTVSDTATSSSDRPLDTEALDLIDRRALWSWLGAMKQPSGGFTMAAGGEEDIRGAYCAAVLLSLLNLPLELPKDSPGRRSGFNTFTDGLGEWVGRCQSFEGGIGGAPSNEAHGAYAFCGLAALCTLGEPRDTVRKYLDVQSLLHWLSSRQYAPEGGFAGRANKLVDGCYSHWVGGCWSLIGAALSPAPASSSSPSSSPPPPSAQEAAQDLWSREGLARYILCCAQEPSGGLRDKPSKRPDAYHSCYNLCGLSAAQHIFDYEAPKEDAEQPVTETGNGLTAAYGWRVVGAAEGLPCDGDDRVRAVHPVFAIPFEKAKACREYFVRKGGW